MLRSLPLWLCFLPQDKNPGIHYGSDSCVFAKLKWDINIFFIITRVTRIRRMLKWSMTSVPHDSSYLNSTQRHKSTLIQTIEDVTVHAIARLRYIFSSYLEMFFELMLIPDPKRLCNVPTFFRLVPVRFLKNIFFLQFFW